MDQDIGQGRTVVVTGASSGIGRACALGLEQRGFRVFATYRKDEDAESLRADGAGTLLPVRLDVVDPASIREAVAKVTEAIGDGGLHGLVNNAGIALAGPLEFLPVESVRNQLEVNVIGQVAVTQAFLPALRTSSGRIVNMGSISGRLAAPFVGPYAASKYALEAISDALRIELMPWDIDVSIIEPGAIDTPIWQRSEKRARELTEDFPPEAESLYGKAVDGLLRQIQRMKGTPTEPVVEAVVHALTADRPRARYVVGRDAKTRLWLAYVPTRFRDWLVAKTIYG